MVRLRTPPKVPDGGRKGRNDTVTSRDKAIPHPHINCLRQEKRKKKNRSNFALNSSIAILGLKMKDLLRSSRGSFAYGMNAEVPESRRFFKILIFLPQLQRRTNTDQTETQSATDLQETKARF